MSGNPTSEAGLGMDDSRVASLAFFGKICNFWLFLTLGFFLKKKAK